MANRTFYKGANLIDGTGTEPLHDAGFLVDGKEIVQVGKVEDFKLDSDVDVVDLTGKTVMPGMINCHVHITMEPVGDPMSIMTKESSTKAALRGVANLKKQLKSGVTYFRDLGAPGGADLDLRNAVREGLVEGPDFQVAGKVITMTGGHGWFMGRECDGLDEVRKATREQLKAGVDVIKIMATGGVMTPGVEPGSPQLTIEEMTVAVDEAHKAGKKTATHAQGTTGIKNAVLAGIDSVEHGIFLDDEVIGLMIQKNVYLVPTLAAPFQIVENGVTAGIPEFAVKKSKDIMDIHFESFKKALKAGVKIAMGTDAGTPLNLHDQTAMELKLMVKGGMTPMEAIVSSTKTGAGLLGIEEKYGTLQVGKAADFLVLKENPLDNLDTLYDIESVYKGGRLVE